MVNFIDITKVVARLPHMIIEQAHNAWVPHFSGRPHCSGPAGGVKLNTLSICTIYTYIYIYIIERGQIDSQPACTGEDLQDMYDERNFHQQQQQQGGHSTKGNEWRCSAAEHHIHHMHALRPLVHASLLQMIMLASSITFYLSIIACCLLG